MNFDHQLVLAAAITFDDSFVVASFQQPPNTQSGNHHSPFLVEVFDCTDNSEEQPVQRLCEMDISKAERTTESEP